MTSAIAALGAAAFGLALVSAPLAASAQEVKLSYADLDLSTSAGAATFSQRLDVAAKAWCTGGPVYTDSSKKRCMAEARTMFLGSIPVAKRTAFDGAMAAQGVAQGVAQAPGAAAPAGS